MRKEACKKKNDACISVLRKPHIQVWNSPFAGFSLCVGLEDLYLKKIISELMAVLIFCMFSWHANAAENLLGNDFSSLYKWGGLKSKPAGTGEGKLEGNVLTMTRKKTGGDFKLTRDLGKLEAGVDYRFLCKVKKTNGGSALIRIISLDGGKVTELFTQKVSSTDEWIDINAVFRKPETSKMVLIQFFVPDEVEGSLSISQMTLLPAAEPADASAILKPVIAEKKYKPAVRTQAPDGLTLYVEKNVLMNGDFSRKQPNLNLPLYWQHTYGLDAPEHWTLYSLKDGRFIFKCPFYLRQMLDITPEIPGTCTFSFSASIESGTLSCLGGYQSTIDQNGGGGVFQKKFPASGERRDYSFDFEMKPEYKGNVSITFYAENNANVDLGDVRLTIAKPKTPEKEKDIYIEGGDRMYSVSGICMPVRYSYYELKAAKYLRKYLFLATGRYVDIFLAGTKDVKEKSGLVYIGNEFTLQKEKEGLKLGGFAVRSSGGSLRIGGLPNDDGVIQGVFAALRKLGFAFYTEYDCEFPSDEILCLPEFEQAQNPAFHLRFASSYDRNPFDALGYSDPFLYASPHRVGRWSLCDHTAPFLVEPNIYFKEHPEYYAMDGKGERKWPRRGRSDIHLCMSNPEVQKIAIDTMLQWIDAEPWAKVFFVYEGDGSDWCQCPNCRAWDVAGSDPAQGHLSDRLIRFVNIVAGEVAKKYPDKLIATLAYTGTRNPPLKEKPGDNVVIVYCAYPPVWNCTRHAFCPENLQGWREFWEWARLYPGKMLVYDYPAGGKTPMGGFYSIVQKLRMYAAGNVQGMYFCGWDSFERDFVYVIGRLLWNPYINVETEIDKCMKFRYGKEVFPYFREYFNMLTEKEMSQSLHRPELEVKVDRQQGYVIVDHKFFSKGKALLEKALSLSRKNNGKGFEDIERQKMKLLTEYLLNYNKASGLKGDALADFARNLGEMLSLCKKYKLPYPVWWLSMREMLMTRAQIDIGDTVPWYKSPVVDELIRDPVPLITSKTFSYEKTETGLKFTMSMISGGEVIANYQYAGVPKTVKPSAKTLRRASSPYSKLTTTFELEKTPTKDAILSIEGLDDEKPGKAALKVTINGKTFFDGENIFSETDWSSMEIKVPVGLLVQGENTLTIQNATPDRSGPQGTVELQEVPKEDYSWGWVLISNCEIKW